VLPETSANITARGTVSRVISPHSSCCGCFPRRALPRETTVIMARLQGEKLWQAWIPPCAPHLWENRLGMRPQTTYGPFRTTGWRPTPSEHRGRPGFDVGCEAVQCMPRPSDLVNHAGNLQTPTTSVSLSPPNTGELCPGPLTGRIWSRKADERRVIHVR